MKKKFLICFLIGTLMVSVMGCSSKDTENTQISVFAFGNKAYGVCERGFHYPLDNYDLDPFEPLGISNDIKGDFGEISVKNGTLVVIETKM